MIECSFDSFVYDGSGNISLVSISVLITRFCECKKSVRSVIKEIEHGWVFNLKKNRQNIFYIQVDKIEVRTAMTSHSKIFTIGQFSMSIFVSISKVVKFFP